uniref:histidine kinase n=1 Tax=Chromera velia CCMP2878 TaxID=1169474 RepID=A0A0G4FYR7_9ALVE|eukprot:Cvel_19411.t1-p1 / transcript=Cvel_19411.t1 / gene=Cvel_19411 / organism=Chromera_velia_CCMP2878 / gene_product=Non-motile and phage-resistance protein, putative / transcript_product=Non-motile and phage-resistance protein, putative / location=Cvel_scaffold1671:35043-37872(-) / protein_length=623 / sequence_SO=supercontig / SO=protein_coding / is_pseudo=false
MPQQPDGDPSSDPRTVALRRQLEKMRVRWDFLFALGWVPWGILWASGSVPALGAVAGITILTLVMQIPNIALHFRQHTDLLLALVLSFACWGNAVAFGVLDPGAIPENQVSKMPLHHGGSFFCSLAVGNSFQLRTGAFMLFALNHLLSFACMRTRFVRVHGSPEDHMDTLAMLFFAGLCFTLLRWIRDEAFHAAVEFKKLKQDAEKTKHSFLAYIMHEVRNPLSSACLLMCEQAEVIAELMEVAEGMESKSEISSSEFRAKLKSLHELSATISSQIEQMGNICDDVLHLEKLASGTFAFSFSPQSLLTFFEDEVRQADPVFKSKGLTLKTEVRVVQAVDAETESEDSAAKGWGCCVSSLMTSGDEKPLAGRVGVWADFARLKQVVSNFLSNARKFSPEGGTVFLTLEVRPLPSDRLPAHTQQGRGGSPQAAQLPDEAFLDGGCKWVHMRVSVRDEGVGLKAEDLQKLFKPYSQIRAGEQQNGGGTGLGLCISRVFVEAHCGGKIGASSEGSGKGSEFFFEFDSPLVDVDVDIDEEVSSHNSDCMKEDGDSVAAEKEVGEKGEEKNRIDEENSERVEGATTEKRRSSDTTERLMQPSASVGSPVIRQATEWLPFSVSVSSALSA